MQKYQSRELLITEEVKWFIEKCGVTEKCQDLLKDIHDALIQPKRSGLITMSVAGGFLLNVIEPVEEGEPERVVVWHGPSDGGIFYNPKMLERAVRYEIGLA